MVHEIGANCMAISERIVIVNGGTKAAKNTVGREAFVHTARGKKHAKKPNRGIR